MPISLLPQFIFISLLLICSTNFSHAYKQCTPDQKTLLLHFKNELKFNSSKSQKLVRWNQTDNCCSWEGVECDDVGHVISLQLYQEGIYGGLESSSSLFSLRYLKKLNLGSNNFNRDQIPRGIGNLTYLTHLDLSNAGFDGQIPIELSLLTRLVSLDLSSMLSLPYQLNFFYLHLAYNTLSGSIPQFLFGLPSLQTLYLSNNQFSGRLHEFQALNFSNIKELYLSSNQLEGPIPESFFQLESIEILDLSNNQFNGRLHEFPTLNFSNINNLDLSSNQLEGPIPESFFQLESIEELYLSDNQFSSLGKQPDFLKQSPTLNFLDLSNNRIAGDIPSWIWEIGNGTLDRLGKLGHLNLSCNLLVDLQKPYKIPASLGLLDLHSNKLQGELPLPPQQAYYVDYSNNNFLNSIPPNIGNFTSSLQFFSLKNNSISGSIPPSLCNSLSLQVLDLSLNKLTGTIPPCLLKNMESLQVLNLGRNNISGEIPDKFSINCCLTTLELSDNNLTGDVPLSLASCKSLLVMNVRNNKMNDTFPCMLSSSLRILVLNSNRFYGEVRCNKTWLNLQIIDIASNNFSGNLHPKSFSSWRGMMAVNDAQLEHNRSDFNVLKGYYYQNEVTLTIKGLEHKLVKIWPDFTSIDFSCNNFKGEIPKAIGDLTLLYLLNLSHNALTGAIPKSLGKLTELGSLDLSENELTGVIPRELAKLTFLSVLKLSFNKLVGEIPIGSQIQTFSVDSFEGNMGLCGKPTNISCRNITEVGSVKLEEKTMEIEWEYVSIVFGYVVGLGSFVWVLCGCMRFRDIYFHKIEEILEKILVGHKRRRRRSVGRRR